VGLERAFDLAIIGAGPAGASALASLTLDASVIIVDAGNKLSDAGENEGQLITKKLAPSVRTPGAGKVCGGLLTKPAQKHLKSTFGDLPDSVKAKPFKTRIECYDFDLKRFFSFSVPYANCQRESLDRFLLEKALQKHSAEYVPHARLIAICGEGKSWRLRIRAIREGWEREIEARFVIDASGWRQTTRRLLGKPLAPTLNAIQVLYALKSPPHPNYIVMFDSRLTSFFAWWIPKSYLQGEPAGSAVVEQHFAELGAGFPPSIQRNPRELMKIFASHLQEKRIELGEAIRVRGCPLVKIERMSDIWLGEGSLLVAGESAGLVSPSSGDGISYAIASGISAGKCVSRFLKNHRRSYESNEHRLVADYRALLRPQLTELRINIFKARLLSSPRGRRVLGALFKAVLPFKVKTLASCNNSSLGI